MPHTFGFDRLAKVIIGLLWHINKEYWALVLDGAVDWEYNYSITLYGL
jgi:hypothetical protein